MIRFAQILVVLAIALTATAQVQPLGGYVPEATPFSNPLTFSEPTPTIPSSPDCTIRPQTVVEIQRMRETATSIAQSIQHEVVVMNRRKAYIEQMTNYLNDRIGELNKVKLELSEELRWMTVSQGRIQELAQREKLVRYQDILSCLNKDQENLAGEKLYKAETLKKLQAENNAVLQNMKKIQMEISRAQQGLTGPAGAAAEAPAL